MVFYYSRQFLVVGITLAWCLAVIEPNFAQENFRAKIRKIADTKGKKPRTIKKETDRVQYQRCGKWSKAKPKIKLYDGDRVLVKSLTFIELEMRSSQIKGRFTLWADTLKANKSSAVFEIQKDPKKLGWYGLFVSYGSIVADKLRGFISSKSRALEVIAHGTRYLMTVDEQTGRTFVFVDQGDVTVIGNRDTLRLRPLDAVQALPGGFLQKVNLSIQETNSYLRLIKNNHTKFVSRLWWKHWYLIAPAVGGTVFGAYQVFKPPDKTVRGSINVKIP